MSDWITKEAARIREQQTKRDQEQQWTYRCRQIISREWQTIWGRVEAAIRRDVDVFNRAFPSAHDHHIQLLDTTPLAVRRDVGQSQVRVVRIFPSEEGIRSDCILTDFRAQGETQRTLENPRLEYMVMPDGTAGVNLSGKVATPETVSETILSPLFR